MKHLYDLDKKFLMLPLDEGTEGIFVINANDRTITVPNQFNKCGAVQNDKMCEIAIFTIDRYYDFQDLAELYIEVLWINAAGKTGSMILNDLVDLDTYPGKIRFGWPLTGDITEKDGAVQFSIRFCNTNTKDSNVKYILNTLPAIINVKKGLIVINPESEYNSTASLFDNFIQNSQNPSYVRPIDPAFGEPGQNLLPILVGDK
jgi:hypothetical protein